MSLVKYSEYNRKEVHDLFVPGEEYKPWAGAWGSSGLVRLPTSESDFVFFVTFGTEISGHRFDEGITRDGVLSWQSQPAQSLSTPRIQQLIRHDEDKNDIFLLLRTEKVRDYTYLGRLKYLLHDSAREKPVYFQWQILDWDLPDPVREEMGLLLDEPNTEPSIGQSSGQVSPPQRSDGQGRAVPTGEFQAVKGKDWGAQEAANKRWESPERSSLLPKRKPGSSGTERFSGSSSACFGRGRRWSWLRRALIRQSWGEALDRSQNHQWTLDDRLLRDREGTCGLGKICIAIRTAPSLQLRPCGFDRPILCDRGFARCELLTQGDAVPSKAVAH